MAYKKIPREISMGYGNKPYIFSTGEPTPGLEEYLTPKTYDLFGNVSGGEVKPEYLKYVGMTQTDPDVMQQDVSSILKNKSNLVYDPVYGALTSNTNIIPSNLGFMDKLMNRAPDIAAIIASTAIGGPTLGGAVAGGINAQQTDQNILSGMLKGGVTGWAGGQIAQGVGDLVGYNPAIAEATWSSAATPATQLGAQLSQNVLTGAGQGALQSAISGRDIGQGMISGGISGGTGTLRSVGTNLAGSYLDQAMSGANNMADYSGEWGPLMTDLGYSDWSNYGGEWGPLMTEPGYTDWANSLSPADESTLTNLYGSVKAGYNALKEATGLTGGQMLSGAANLLGGYLQGKSATGAAQTSAEAQLRAAQLAADAAKFRPIGVTTRFGRSQFGYDANGNLISAGYGLAPDVLAQQNQLMGATDGLLNQYTGAQQATAPMGQAAQSMMTLGQGYLGTSPQEQAAKYMAEQQALLAGPRAAEYARMQQQLQNTGRAGLSMGGGGGMTAANPEMQAYYNALNQQNLALAAQATQGGMDYSKFGAGMVGSGGEMLKGMYGTQQAAYAPYQTMLGAATGLENLGQQAMNIGTELGGRTTAATAAGGTILGQGMLGAAQTMQPANAYSPWGAMLTGAGQAIGQYAQPTQQPGMIGYDPGKFRLTPL